MKKNYHLSANLLETKQPILIDKTEFMSIWISKSKYTIPYFIVYNSQRIDSATKCCRIHCYRSEYVCVDDVDLPEWILSDGEKIHLMILLTKEKYPGTNNWKYIRSKYIDYCGWNYEAEHKPILIMPNYLNIIKPRDCMIYKGSETYNFHLSKLLCEEQWDQYIIYRDPKYDMMIMVFPSPYTNPYMIIYNDFCASATKSCRVYLYEAKYLYAGDTDIMECKLTDSEVDHLVEIFTPSMWDSAVENYLYYLQNTYKLPSSKPEWVTMPDYGKLKGC